MESDLAPLKKVLRELSEMELRALVETSNNVQQLAPGLLAWIEHAADWELSRRRKIDFMLNAPKAAIPPEEEAISIEAVLSIRKASLSARRQVAAFLDALLTLLPRRQWLH